MMVLKKKEIIAAALVVLIGVAGYLNWSYQDTVRVTDGEIYEQTGKRLGEAQYVNSTKSDVEDSENKKEETQETKTEPKDKFAAARLDKENARSKSLEILNQSAANESFDDETRKAAQDRILKMADDVQKEATIENIAKAKGFEELAVYIDGESVDILVRKADLSENDVNKLKDIAAEQLNTGAKNIKIVQVQ